MKFKILLQIKIKTWIRCHINLVEKIMMQAPKGNAPNAY